MLKFFLPFVALVVCAQTHASDIDLIKEACVAMKAVPKRTQCLSALDRLTSSPPPASPQPAQQKPVTLNLRAFMCKPHEFAELNSMNQHELASASCSYQVGLKSYQDISEKSIVDERNSRTKLILMQRQVSEMEKCGAAMMMAMDVQKRKFPESKADCTPLQKKVPATESANTEQ